MGKLKPGQLLESFPLGEEIDQLMELMLAKILLKFGAAQATCKDDDEHIMSQLFKSKKEKDLLRRMEPQLLMCVFNNTAVQKGLASRYVVKAKPGKDEVRPSLARLYRNGWPADTWSRPSLARMKQGVVQKWLARRYMVKAKPGKDEVRPSLARLYRNGWPADTWSRPSLARMKQGKA